jgi:hypothetical protein
MTEAAATTGRVQAETPVPITSSERTVAFVWERYVKSSLIFLVLLVGYQLSFSYLYGNGLSAAYELQGRRPLLVEFRHLMNHLWPFWLFHLLQGFHLHLEALSFLHFFDLITAVTSVMLFSRVLLEITKARFVSLAGTFAYATANCVWTYTGTGKMYMASMLLALAAYYLALQIGKASTEGRRWVIVIAAAALVCFACFFWLVQVFNAVGVGLLIFLLPQAPRRSRRWGYLSLYSFTGAVLTLAVLISCLHYVQVPFTRSGMERWIAETRTPPMVFGLLGLLAAPYGQANGFLATPGLLYMIHGMMLKDPVLIKLGSLPWQLGKFIFISLLLALVYVYPWVIFKRASRQLRILIFALYLPLAINTFFALGWLGTDLQRFLPTMLSQIGLGAIAMQELLGRVPRPRQLGALVTLILVFIAGDNLLESLLPSQREYKALAEQMKAIRPDLHRADWLITFGKDLNGDDTYDRLVLFYTDAKSFSLTNDAYTYSWDRPDWQLGFASLLDRAEKDGGRLFVIDRLVLGFNPPEAAWSAQQHSRPTVKQFSHFLHNEYRLTPAFHIGKNEYFEVSANKPAISPALATIQPGGQP